MSEIGIFQHLPFEEYRALPHLNYSVLKLMDRDESYGATPLHAKAAFDGQLENDDTKTLQLGRAEHCWICEGEEAFRERYVVAPSVCEATTKEGKACSNAPTCRREDGMWLCGVHSRGRDVGPTYIPEFINTTDLDRIKAMAESVRSHEINTHLRRKGWSECTIVYDVPVTFFTKGQGEHGPTADRHESVLRHKVRIDRLGEPAGRNPYMIADIKRMQLMEGRRHQREKVIAAYGWDVQAAMYCEAVKAHFGVDRCHYIWVFVEEKKPHDVVWFQADDDTLRIGADKLWRYRQEWAACLHSGHWPAYCEGDQPKGGLNDYYRKKYLERFADDTGKFASEVGQRASA